MLIRALSVLAPGWPVAAVFVVLAVLLWRSTPKPRAPRPRSMAELRLPSIEATGAENRIALTHCWLHGEPLDGQGKCEKCRRAMEEL